jgi:hypothetical protein
MWHVPLNIHYVVCAFEQCSCYSVGCRSTPTQHPLIPFCHLVALGPITWLHGCLSEKKKKNICSVSRSKWVSKHHIFWLISKVKNALKICCKNIKSDIYLRICIFAKSFAFFEISLKFVIFLYPSGPIKKCFSSSVWEWQPHRGLEEMLSSYSVTPEPNPLVINGAGNWGLLGVIDLGVANLHPLVASRRHPQFASSTHQ